MLLSLVLTCSALIRPSFLLSLCPADLHWSDMQQVEGPLQGSYEGPAAHGAQEEGADEFGPMAGAPARMSSGGLAEVAIHSGAQSPVGGAGKGKQALGRRPSIQLTVDSRAHGQQSQPAAAAATTTAAAGSGHHDVRPPPVRQESTGLEYAADSKAVMARINRWWKNFDEGIMQPRFGGPAGHSRHNSSANLAAAAGTGTLDSQVQSSSKSFTVPVSRPGG